MNKTNKKGFTLAELLIVVAIIAVLVAIAIPVFNAQLEKSRESVDAANLRSAYAECAAEIMTADEATYTTAYKKVDPQQTKEGWTISFEKIGTVAKADVPDMKTGTTVYVEVKNDGTAIITATKPAAATALEVK